MQNWTDKIIHWNQLPGTEVKRLLATWGKTPADIAKHIDIVRNATHATVAFATMTISAHNRSRLIGQGVPFIVPGNQLYIPDLAIDLREHFRASRHRQADGLSPAAQTVLFHQLPKRNYVY